MRSGNAPLVLPFYFLATRRNLTLDEVRALPGIEFFAWLRLLGFEDALARKK